MGDEVAESATAGIDSMETSPMKPSADGAAANDVDKPSLVDPPAAAEATPTAPATENGSDTNNKTEDATNTAAEDGGKAAPVVSSSKKTRPPYKYDPNKITLRFIFANRDGLTVTVECLPADTVGEVKAALLSVWPDDLPDCSGGDYLRLICMGKGMLSPDSRTLEDCQIPVFKTHPTPVNVSVRPAAMQLEKSNNNANDSSNNNNNNSANGNNSSNSRRGASSGNGTAQTAEAASQGCACIIL